MTAVTLYDHVSGLRDVVSFDVPRDILIHRLRLAIEPLVDFDPACDMEVYARVDVDPIAIHFTGYPEFSPQVLALWNSLLAELGRALA